MIWSSCTDANLNQIYRIDSSSNTRINRVKQRVILEISKSRTITRERCCNNGTSYANSTTNNAEFISISSCSDTNSILINAEYRCSRTNLQCAVTRSSGSNTNSIKYNIIRTLVDSNTTESSPCVICGVNPTNIST